MGFKLIIDNEKCTLCETCVDICRDEVLKCKNDKIVMVADDCQRCESCTVLCPVNAITCEF